MEFPSYLIGFNIICQGIAFNLKSFMSGQVKINAYEYDNIMISFVNFIPTKKLKLILTKNNLPIH